MIQTATDLLQEDRITRARSRLINKFPLIGIVGLGLSPLEDRTVKTGWTDGVHMGYNPDWIAKQTLGEVVGFVAHESGHVLLKHNFRRGNRDPKLWSIACDLVLNAYLKYQVKLQLPSDGLFDPKFMGSTVELVYLELAKIKKEKDKQKQMVMAQNPDQPCNGGEGDGDSDDDADNSQQAQDQSNGQNNGQSKDQNNGQTQSQPKPQQSLEDIFGKDEVDLNKLLNDDVDLDDLLNQDDPGGCGEVRDYPAATEEEKEQVKKEAGKSEKEQEKARKELEQTVQERMEKAEGELDTIIAQAQTMQDSKDQKGWSPTGNGGSIRIVNQLLDAHVPWEAEVRDFFEQICKNDYSWAMPNRRYSRSPFVVPSLYNKELGRFIALIDASGSINDREFNIFGAELTNMLNIFQDATIMTIFFHHCVINDEIREYTYHDLPIKLKTTGRGGTDFVPPFKKIEEDDLNPVGVLVFTDLGCDSYPKEPDYPVMWVVTEKRYDGTYYSNPPFGRIIDMDLDHYGRY